MKVTFQGASDDCIEIAGCPGADEFYANANDFGLFLLSTENGERLLVRVAYEHHGCWSVGFAPYAEGEPIPPWPISVGSPINDYTACLVVDCPDDVTLTREDA